MKPAAILPSFEVNLNNMMTPTSVIAVFQSINTLTKGEVLKVRACNHHSIMAVISYCKDSGNTLLGKENHNDEVTLFIKKK